MLSTHPPQSGEMRGNTREGLLSCPLLLFFFRSAKSGGRLCHHCPVFGAEKEANALLLSNRVTILNSELILQSPGHNHLIPGRRTKEFL